MRTEPSRDKARRMVEETRRLMELTATEGGEGARILSVRKHSVDRVTDEAPDGTTKARLESDGSKME